MRKALILILSIGCTSPTRFKDAPPVTRIDERRIAQPEEIDWWKHRYYLDIELASRSSRILKMHPFRPAGDINSLDEVPDSNWFTNRNPTPEEIRAGPNVDPEDGYDFVDWTVVAGKSGGTAPGLMVKDAQGRLHLMKFDQPGFPEMETGVDGIVSKLFWAFGYFVAEDYILYLRRDNLKIAPGATVKDIIGRKRPLTEGIVDHILSQADGPTDGVYRALVSRFVPGPPLGVTATWGTREDDHNDKVPHQHRRTMRALYVFSSWTNHVDLKEDNTLDAFVDGRVRHYLIDFGKALGAFGTLVRSGAGFVENWDLEYFFVALPSMGMYVRPWERLETSPLKGVGELESEHYEPDHWSALSPYPTFDYLTPADAFWAAKIIMRLTPEHIRAAVEAGRLTDPRSREALVEILLKRQRKLGRTFFTKVSPLDDFTVKDGALVFDDLAVDHDLVNADAARYGYRALDSRGEDIRAGESADRRVPLAADGYEILDVRAIHEGRQLPPVRVHVGASSRTVIGIERNDRSPGLRR